MEPWDGPASIVFSDGTLIGATLDRNGLRPSRYVITHDDMVVMASEVGVLPIPPEKVRHKGRLQPGKMFLVDTGSGRIIGDDEFKAEISRRRPYQLWVEQNHLGLDDLPEPERLPEPDPAGLLPRQQAFGYTWEDLFRVLLPMAQDGKEPVSSMGNDTPLAVLSRRSQLLYNYFKQMFAQVTNPPIDPIREKIVMNTESLLGSEANLLDETPEHARLLRLESPTLHDADLARIRALRRPGFEVRTLSMLFDRAAGEAGLAAAMERLCAEASEAVQGGATILVLSDRGVDAEHVPVPALLATAGVHHHLIRAGLRTRCGLVVETGEAREIHHFALLIGYGAAAVNPYMVFETFRGLTRDRMLLDPQGNPLDPSRAVKNYATSIDQGLLKIFSKMGISTLMSYRGAQIFEAIGLNRDLVDRYFTGTPSRIEGIGLDVDRAGVAAAARGRLPWRARPRGAGARRRRRARCGAAGASITCGTRRRSRSSSTPSRRRSSPATRSSPTPPTTRAASSAPSAACSRSARGASRSRWSWSSRPRRSSSGSAPAR